MFTSSLHGLRLDRVIALIIRITDADHTLTKRDLILLFKVYEFITCCYGNYLSYGSYRTQKFITLTIIDNL